MSSPHPLVFYWIVKYHDGTSLAQYNKDGIENMWGMVNIDAIESFTWQPFNKDDAKKINLHYGDLAHATDLKPYTLKLERGETVIAFRRNYIRSTGERSIIYVVGSNKKTIVGITETGEILEEVP